MHVSTCGAGIRIRIEAIRPAAPDLYWYENELCIEVDLAWWTLEGNLAPAPWRREHRESIVTALTERNWAAVYSPGLPLGRVTDSADDAEDPPLAPDMHISARVAAAVMSLYCLSPEEAEPEI